MPDNIDVTPGTGATVATDLVSSAHYQVIKVALGADGAVDAHLDSGQQLMAASVPVVLASDQTDVKVTLDGESVTISGTVTVGSHAVTNAGTFAVQVDGSALTALQLIDDCIYVDDADWTATTSKHALVGGLYQSSPGTITDGDVGPLRVNSNGALHVAIVSGAGSGGTASDDDADFTAGSTSGTPAIGVYESSPSSVTDGDLGVVGITQTRALRCSVENTVTVAAHAVTNAGTFAVQVTGDALTALQLLDNAISGSEMQVDVVAALPAGDNNIGNVDIASAIPAGTNLIGKVSSSNETSTVYDGTTALTPKFAVIDAATSGDNTIVAAVVGKKIRVLNVVLVASAAVTARFESGAGGTALTGQVQLADNGGFSSGYCPLGHFETAANTLLNLELSGAVSVDGWLTYVEV